MISAEQNGQPNDFCVPTNVAEQRNMKHLCAGSSKQ